MESLQGKSRSLGQDPSLNMKAKSTAETARILYEHVSKLIDEDQRVEERVVSKVHKLLFVHTAMFAGISYGMQYLDWTANLHEGLRWAVVISAAVAALFVLFAFISGIRCLFLSERKVAGIEEVLKRIESKEFLRDSPVDAYSGLTLNLAKSLLDNRSNKSELLRWNGWLNKMTIVGAVMVAIFVAVALGGSVIL